MSYTSIWPLPFIETKPCDTDLKSLLVDTLVSAPMPCVTRIEPELENLHMRAAVFTVSPATRQLLSLQTFIVNSLCANYKENDVFGQTLHEREPLLCFLVIRSKKQKQQHSLGVVAKREQTIDTVEAAAAAQHDSCNRSDAQAYLHLQIPRM
jgi:hypothetical protein